MYLPEPFCKSATKSKVSVVIHSDYGLTGGCWGNGLPGFWIGPGATADHWGLAHEFMHSVQCSVGSGLNCGSGANTCGWIYESHANWAAQQQPGVPLFQRPLLRAVGERAAPLRGVDARSLLRLAVHGVPQGQVLLFRRQQHLAQLARQQRSVQQHHERARLEHRPAERLLRRVGDAQRDLGLRRPGAREHRRRRTRAASSARTTASSPTSPRPIAASAR